MLPLLLVQLLTATAPPVPIHGIERPFENGEELVYDARVSLFGRVGVASLRVEATCPVDDRAALVLSFDVNGGAGFLRVEDETRSWVDALTLETLRYEKRESSPLGSHRESVTLDREARRWVDAGGDVHQTAAVLPLDELSILYFIRTLPLVEGDSELPAGHFDSRRNPIALRVIGRSVVDVPAGRVPVIDVELKVRDPRRYRGTGVIRIQLSDDERRIPVRIRTSLPGSSAVTLELRTARSATGPAPSCP